MQIEAFVRQLETFKSWRSEANAQLLHLRYELLKNNIKSNYY